MTKIIRKQDRIHRERRFERNYPFLSIAGASALLGMGCAGEPAEHTPPAPTDNVMFTDHVHLMPLDNAPRTAAGTPPAPVAPAGAHLTYFGGKVVQNARVTQVLYGPGTYIPELTSTSGVNMASSYTQMLTSGVFDWLSEYNTSSPAQLIGRGSFAGSVQISPAANRNGSTITDASIQSEIAAQIQAGTLPAPSNNQIYMVSFPSGRSIVGSDGSVSCVQFCAYHGTFKIGSQNVYYGVLPDLTTGCASGCGTGTTFQNQQSIASHELIETVTDAEIGLTTVIGPPLAWYDRNLGEIGDICNHQHATFTGTDGNTYTVQREFSNQQNDCIAVQPTLPPPLPPIPTPLSDEKFDLNGDGMADVCGRGRDGVSCAISTGTGFGPVTLWEAAFSDANQFDQGPEFYSTIRFPDLNHDGRADICGRGREGVFCALNTGTSFGQATLWTSFFSDANQWNAGPQYYSTIQFPDVNNDGNADICGRGRDGVSCALGTGTSFGSATLWEATFSDANQFNLGPEYYSTIRFPDLNNDGRADICGRGRNGVFCELSTGTSFGSPSVWTTFFSDANQFNLGPQYYSTIQFPDVNHDGRADICGRGREGVSCALSTGTAFGQATLWETTFSDANQFDQSPDLYSTIRFPDLNNDGRADICGRGRAGVFCELSTGTSFGSQSVWTTFFSDANQWNAGPEYYSTIRFPDVNHDGRADICGRGRDGVSCALSSGTGFGQASLWTSFFSDANQFNAGPQYYSTIHFP